MSMSPSHAPGAPSPEERARSMLARRCPATVVASARPAGAESVDLADTTGYVHDDGDVDVLVPDGHPLLSIPRTDRRANPVVMVEFIDLAPLRLRDRTRALLWISGTLTVLDHDRARERALSLIDTDPDDRLLDVGHGTTMVGLRPALLVHSDHDGAHVLHPRDLAAASPDPFSRWEGPWLRHLDQDHADLVGGLMRHVAPHLRGGRPRPLGVDRLGLRLRVETGTGHHDVRLPFRRPARTPRDISAEVRRLAGYPIAHGSEHE